MEMKIEKVVVGSDRRSSPAEMKSEPAASPLQPYQHDSLQCFQCFITFSDYKAKERHMRKSHRELYKKQLQQDNIAFTCYTCDKSFSSSEELSLHQPTHSTKEKLFSCPYCQESFFTFTELTRHRRTSCLERRCPCRDCGVLFPSPSRLRSHRIAVHPQLPAVADDNNTYQCCKCSRGFQTEEELLHHQEKFASSLNCDIKPPAKKRGRKPMYVASGTEGDGKTTKREEEEEEEEEGGEEDGCSTEEGTSIDTELELKIPCPEANCDIVFPSISALRAHKRQDHGLPSEQPKAPTPGAELSALTGTTCGESFTQESVLNVHQKTHAEGEEGTEKR